MFLQYQEMDALPRLGQPGKVELLTSAEVNRSENYDQLIIFFKQIYSFQATVIDMSQAFSLFRSAIAQTDDAVRFFDDLADYFENLGNGLIFVSAALELRARIAAVQAVPSEKAGEEAFVQIIDFSAELAATNGVSALAGSLTLLSPLAPGSALVAGFAGFASEFAYETFLSDDVQAWARQLYLDFLEVTPPPATTTQIYVGEASGGNVNGSFQHNLAAGGSGNDTLDGGIGSNTIFGGGGNDIIDGGTGITSADGGLGYDIISADLSAATSDIIWDLRTNSFSGPGSYTGFEQFGTIATGTGNDTIVSPVGLNNSPQDRDIIHTGAGDDRVTVFDIIFSVELGSGFDTFVFDLRGTDFAVLHYNSALQEDGSYYF